MAIHRGTKNSARSATRNAQVLSRLVSGRVFGPHAFFFVTGEGEYFPNGIERSSGLVLDSRGQVWAFWTGWDADRHEVTLAEWEATPTEIAWLEDEEYQLARAAVGVS